MWINKATVLWNVKCQSYAFQIHESGLIKILNNITCYRFLIIIRIIIKGHNGFHSQQICSVHAYAINTRRAAILRLLNDERHLFLAALILYSVLYVYFSAYISDVIHNIHFNNKLILSICISVRISVKRIFSYYTLQTIFVYDNNLKLNTSYYV